MFYLNKYFMDMFHVDNIIQIYYCQFLNSVPHKIINNKYSISSLFCKTCFILQYNYSTFPYTLIKIFYTYPNNPLPFLGDSSSSLSGPNKPNPFSDDCCSFCNANLFFATTSLSTLIFFISSSFLLPPIGSS